jgi:Na+-transporting NADH:ubiquinone oxidoreductase subunit C
MQHSTSYIVLFAAAVCAVCSVFVSGAAVLLADRQAANIALDRQKKVLAVAGLIQDGENISGDAAQRLFDENIVEEMVDLESGAVLEGADAASFDQRKAAKDPATSREAPPNAAKVRRVPDQGLVYRVVQGGEFKSVIVPISGQGLWSTLYGYIALAADTQTVLGITFYEHGETPGLGGEIDNPRWKALWKGRKVYDGRGRPLINVKKGLAGPADTDPYNVDGLSGATITSRGVGNLVRFWLGQDGFGPYLASARVGGQS